MKMIPLRAISGLALTVCLEVILQCRFCFKVMSRQLA